MGQEIELDLGASPQVFSQCARIGEAKADSAGIRWTLMRARVSNANPHPVTMRIMLAQEAGWGFRFPGERLLTKNGIRYVEVEIAANSATDLDWQIRPTDR